MSNLNSHPVRRTAAGVLAGALAFSGAFATPAFAAPGFTLERLAGADRYATSAAIAAQFGTADGAILASGEDRHVVDALSASFLAGIREDPVVLTSRGQVSAQVLAQLNNLTNKRVTIVGGEMAVSQAVETQLRTAGFTVTRIAGDDRYETSEAIVRAGAAEGNESPIGILASGQSPVDALAAGALAYEGDHPLFLTAGGTIPQSTLDAMQAAGTTSVIIVGGETVVPESVRTQLAARNISVVTRLGGADRSATSRQVADYLINNMGFSASTFNVASGANNGVDALSGAALSGKNNTVLLVTNTATDPGSVDDFATARQATLTTAGRIFGGESVVAPALETQIESAGGAAAANQTFTVTPNTAVTLTVADENNAQTRNSDDRQYTVTNPVAGATHTIALFPASAVSVSASGVVTFADTDNDDEADDLGNVSADIVVVNGAAQAADTQIAEVMPAGGQISFTVDGDADETVIPVVFFDADTQGDLDLTATNSPVSAEAFGLGGAIDYNPGEAQSGTLVADQAITAADEDSNAIIAGGALYQYDDNDRYFIDANDNNVADVAEQVTMAEFELQLSVGDELSNGTAYNATDAFTSTFLLEDRTPGAPTVTATGGQGSAELDITPPAGFDADDTLTVERAAVTGLGADGVCGGGDDVVGTYSTVATLTQAGDEDTTTPAVIDFSNAAAAGCYSYRVTGNLDGEETTAVVASAAITADTTAPTLASATPGEINNGVGSTNRVLVTFSEPVATVVASGLTVYPTNQAALEIAVTGASRSNTAGTVWTLTLAQELQDASNDISYTVSADADAISDVAGNENVAGTTTFMY